MTRLALVVLALALAGCGRADDERAASAVTERFLAAASAGDGALACAQLSPGAVAAFDDCPRAVRGLDLRASAVTRAQVYGTAAKVDLADGDSAFLELTPRGWRVAAAGCEPAAGPYDCAVEA